MRNTLIAINFFNRD